MHWETDSHGTCDALQRYLRDICPVLAHDLSLPKPYNKTNLLPRLWLIFTISGLLINLIFRMFSNQCNFPSQEIALRAKLKMKKVSMNSTKSNKDLKLREFVDLSRHLHSPTKKLSEIRSSTDEHLLEMATRAWRTI